MTYGDGWVKNLCPTGTVGASLGRMDVDIAIGEQWRLHYHLNCNLGRNGDLGLAWLWNGSDYMGDIDIIMQCACYLQCCNIELVHWVQNIGQRTR
jgi:hypothetical protein